MSRRVWVCVGLLAVFALAGCRADSGGVEDVTVQVLVTPDPPRIGPGLIVVTLRDLEGRVVSGATVSVEGNMNHAGMVPVLAEAAEVEPGRYEAPLEFTMGGDWFILAQVDLPDGRSFVHQMDVPGVDAVCGTPVP